MLNKNDLNQEQIDKALICFKNAEYKKSINILKNLEKKQSHFLIYWYLGHSYFRIYDYNSAINNIKKSINLKKPDVLNLSFLAEIYLRTNNYTESIKLFKKVLDIDNKNVNSLFNLAKSYLEIGQVDIAEIYYNNLIKEDPTNLEAHYELIRINKNYLTTTLVEKIERNEIPNDENSLNNIFSKFILAEYYKNTKNFKNEIKCLIDAHNNYSIKKDKSSKQEFNYFINLLPKFISKVKETNVKLECDLKPIFVMGLPRSGTTLIENIILSSNDKIDNGGEAGVCSKVFFSENIIGDCKF